MWLRHKKKKMMEKKKIRYAANIIAIAIIVVCGFISINNFSERVDIRQHDETIYMMRGLKLRLKVDYGPLYSLWYYFMHFIVKNKIYLYDVNYIILTIIPACLFYLLYRKFNVNYFISILLATFFLVSNNNFWSWPKVSSFALCIIIPGLILVKKTKSTYNIVYLLISITLLLSYIRPEFTLSLILSWLFFPFILYKSKSLLKCKDYIVLVLLIVLILAFFFSFGNPLSSERARLAFGQHFSLNYKGWHAQELNKINTWDSAIFLNIPKKIFGKPFPSVFGAFKANPYMFSRHVCTNIDNFYSISIEYTSQDFLPINFLKSNKILFTGIIFFIILAAIFKYNGSKEIITENKLYLTFLGIIVLPELLACAFIYPRRHYILIISVLFASIFCLFYQCYQRKICLLIKKINNPDKLALHAGFIIITVFAFVLINFSTYKKTLFGEPTIGRDVLNFF
jgi:hypothetical protein